ncbi:MAG: DUF5682 family protein [Saprospiraceae bacterium]|nr:DUF5682 family protein [Saprospiraceae bacterium]
MSVHILGIRHHGVGSAEMVKSYLKELKPDIILVEGPPEISDQLQLIGHKDLQPPVALIVYDESNLERTSFYPFAEYSPEWVACQYAGAASIPIRAMDLPAAITFNIEDKVEKEKSEGDQPEIYRGDPISYLADIAGYPSGEAWWDDQFELVEFRDAQEHFEGVGLAMKTLREEGIASGLDQENVYREAYMRQLIRTAQNEMYGTIAVICGAWHGPELVDLEQKAKEDAKLLKSLPKSKIKIKCSWIPWTNNRLSRTSGYGAGISSPGWYEHRWSTSEDLEISWLSKVATLFRAQEVDISTAHVLESYRLAHSLAVLRDHTIISYTDLHDAIRTVMCNGDDILFELIKKHLLVNDRIGNLPSDIPKVPLQQDFEDQAKSMRLKLSAMPKIYSLDLRKPLDLKRSIFFHRLNILEIDWAIRKTVRKKGSFKEGWELTWNPKMQILLIDKSSYGTTVEFATQGLIEQTLSNEKSISAFVKLINLCIPAQLFKAMDSVLLKINQIASISNDTIDIMRSLPKLINISRYGDVRKTDVDQIDKIVLRLFNKVSTSLANACYGLDEDNSNEVFLLIGELDRSLKLLEDQDIANRWIRTLEEIVAKEGIHMVIKGCTIRLLFDQNQLQDDELSTLLSYHLSPMNEAKDVAFWVEGFLRGSGLILIYDNRIWNLIYEWVASVNSEQFVDLLPVLRRAFSNFPSGERKQIGQKASRGLVQLESTNVVLASSTIDHEKGMTILPYIQKFLNGNHA